MSRKKPIEITIGDKIKVKPEGVFKSAVRPDGNGACIPFYKQFLGKEVIVLVIEKISAGRGR